LLKVLIIFQCSHFLRTLRRQQDSTDTTVTGLFKKTNRERCEQLLNPSIQQVTQVQQSGHRRVAQLYADDARLVTCLQHDTRNNVVTPRHDVVTQTTINIKLVSGQVQD